MLEQDTAIDRLRQAGLRLTPQRRAVIDAIAGDRTHPSAEVIASRVAERVPGVSLSTVYKTLHELAELDMVLELDLPGATRFDPDPSDHAHLVCTGCGLVFDAPLPAQAVAAISASAAEQTGANVERIEVVLYGACPDCSGR